MINVIEDEIFYTVIKNQIYFVSS